MKRIHRIVGIALGVGGLCAIGATLARAVPSAATRNRLSFSGNVSPPPATGTDVVFKLTNGGATCTVSTKPVFASNGDFATELDLSGCSTFAFDGGEVVYTIKVGTGAESSAQQMNPVPYAKFADRSGRIVVTKGGTSTSAAGTLCKATASIKTGSGKSTGYEGARAACQVACASETAHQCSPEEMTRTVSMGLGSTIVSASSYLWVAAGTATRTAAAHSTTAAAGPRPAPAARMWEGRGRSA